MVIFGLQLLISVWWLQRFRFGPAEWLWRSLTYGKLQPIRIGQLGRMAVGKSSGLGSWNGNETAPQRFLNSGC